MAFVSDFRYAVQADAEVGALARLEIVPTDPLGSLLGLLREHARIQRLGFESHVVTAAVATRLQAEERWRFTATTGLVEELRVRKDPDEIRSIREAGAGCGCPPGVGTEAARERVASVPNDRRLGGAGRAAPRRHVTAGDLPR